MNSVHTSRDLLNIKHMQDLTNTDFQVKTNKNVPSWILQVYFFDCSSASEAALKNIGLYIAWLSMQW